MFESLLDSRLVIYSLLIFVVWVLAALWWRSRKRAFLLGGAVVLVLLVLFVLLNVLAETPRKQIARGLDEMSAGVKARDVDRIFRHIAKDFQYAGQDRERFRDYSTSVLRQGLVTELVIWDLEWPDGGDGRARPVTFKAKPKGPWENEAYYLIKSTFVREADGAWRLQGFKVSNPFVDSQKEIQPPPLR